MKWYDNLIVRFIEKKSLQKSSLFKSQPTSPQSILMSLIFSCNEIDRFFDELFLQINDEKLKFTSIFKQHAFQVARNFMMIISCVNNSFQYIILFISTSSTSASREFSTFFASNIFLFSSKISSISNSNSSVSNKTFQISSKIFEISNNNSSVSNNNSSVANRNFFVANNTPFASSTSSIGIFTLTFIDELIIDSIAQKIRLFNASSIETKLQRTFNHHSEFRFVRNFSMNFLIDLIVLFNCDFVVVKAVLTLLVKVFSIDFHESKTYKKAITNAQHKMNWQFDMNDEMISHKNNKIWILMNEASKKRKILIDKWIYRCKKNINEKIIRYKTRWCVRNFEQLKDLDYHEIFVSMIKFISYKVIFVIVVANNWNVEQMNVKIVFLYDYVNEEIYVKVSHDYIDFERFCVMCRFRKILYDLKQTLRVWSDVLKKNFKQHGFFFLNADQSVFCDEKTIIVIYVNNLLIIGLNTKTNKNIKIVFNKRFQIIDLDFMTHYFEMRFDKNKFQKILWFSQRTYLKKILKNHNFLNNKSVFTSMDTKIKLKVVFAEYIAKFEFKHIYQFVVDFFMYAMFEIRFDIVFVVFVISKYAFNFTEDYWTIVKRIFRYLKNILHFRFTFFDSLRFLASWIDANWVDDKDIRRFIFDYIFNFDNAIIIWFFKRQLTIALSTCEIKYMNQTQAIKKTIWFFDLLNELNTFDMFINIDENLIIFETFEFVYFFVITIIYCNNQKAQAFAKNFINYFRIKHMNIQQHFVRKKIIEKQIQLKHVFTQNQIIDEFIKSLPRNAFEKFRTTLNFNWFFRSRVELSH